MWEGITPIPISHHKGVGGGIVHLADSARVGARGDRVVARGDADGLQQEQQLGTGGVQRL